jgi:hypothetical protein
VATRAVDDRGLGEEAADRAEFFDVLLTDAALYVDWLRQRCGPEIDAPSDLGGGGLTPLVDAPGTYVFQH